MAKKLTVQFLCIFFGLFAGGSLAAKDTCAANHQGCLEDAAAAPGPTAQLVQRTAGVERTLLDGGEREMRGGAALAVNRTLHVDHKGLGRRALKALLLPRGVPKKLPLMMIQGESANESVNESVPHSSRAFDMSDDYLDEEAEAGEALENETENETGSETGSDDDDGDDDEGDDDDGDDDDGEDDDGEDDDVEELKKQTRGHHSINVENALDVINRNSAQMTPAIAQSDGLLVTANDVANLTGVRGEDDGCQEGTECFQGDMIPGDGNQLLLFQGKGKGRGPFAGNLWPDGVVKYCLAADLPIGVKDLVRVSLNSFMRALPCLSFVDVGNPGGHNSEDADADKECAEAPAVFVQSRNMGCWSYVGMLTPAQLAASNLKAQLLNLAYPGCGVLGIAMHEFGHAVGMAHEQARPDRDNFVKILWENIMAGKENNFQENAAGYTGLDYDFLSLMHYDRHSFGIDNKDTIVAVDATHDGEMGQRIGLSQADAEQLQAMYKTIKPTCESGTIDGRTGCADRGSTVCASLTTCSGAVEMMDCCACGGGYQYRCWTGSEEKCRQVEELPVEDLSECLVDRSSIYGGAYPCVVTNVCDDTVQIKCDSNQGYYMDVPGKGGDYLADPFYDVCVNKESCKYVAK